VLADALLALDACGLAEAVRARELTAAEILDASLAQIERRDGEIGAVWLVTEERARREAAAVDRTVADRRDPGPLAGVTTGWKDLIDTAGIRTTYGSALFAGHVPQRDADAVARLAAAGAVCVAKLSLHELAWGTTNDNPHFGTCRNPHDLGRVPGGSSGGSAAALAAGMVALAPGTDTGGSIRIPASCCGIVGLKPTFGRVSLAGVRPLNATLDHCGPMARSVRDCALALEPLAGPSSHDPRTPAVPVERWRDAPARGVRGMTVALAERGFFEHTAPDVAAPVRRAAAALEDAGASLVEVDLGWPDPEIDDVRLFVAEEAATLAAAWPAERERLGADVVRDLEAAERLSAVEVEQTRLARLRYCTQTLELVERRGIDLVLSPTLAFPPPPIGTERVTFAGRERWITTAMCGLTQIYDVLGWPAISVPCGRDGAGLPVGAQLAARPWREADCLAAAAVVEAALPLQ
jgi:aspartyl-tRNA(Asn)/glutamyl-tRNA(Gln) amidotransferase subunit A